MCPFHHVPLSPCALVLMCPCPNVPCPCVPCPRVPLWCARQAPTAALSQAQSPPTSTTTSLHGNGSSSDVDLGPSVLSDPGEGEGEGSDSEFDLSGEGDSMLRSSYSKASSTSRFSGGVPWGKAGRV